MLASRVWPTAIIVVVAVSLFAIGASAVRKRPFTVSTNALPEAARQVALNAVPSLVTDAVLDDVSIAEPSNPVPSAAASSTPISLLFAGDVMLDRSVKIRSVHAGSRSYPFEKLDAAWVNGFDMAVANLEGPVTDKRRPPEKSIDFQFDPEVVTALQQSGFDAFSQANNHALDQGAVGYEDSVRRLREAGFLAFGHQVRDGIISLATTTLRGTNVAFLGWNTTDNPLDRTEARAAIQVAREQAIYVIAYLHWGPEYRDRPHPNEVELAHWLIDQGVDIVIGGHPHWVQGMSMYRGKPIVWSLGNFVFDQDFSVPTKQGLAVSLRLQDKNVSIELHPVRIDASQVSLETGQAKVNRLEAISRVSDEELQASIRNGVVEFKL